MTGASERQLEQPIAKLAYEKVRAALTPLTAPSVRSNTGCVSRMRLTGWRAKLKTQHAKPDAGIFHEGESREVLSGTA
jgi:hypothetical protein